MSAFGLVRKEEEEQMAAMQMSYYFIMRTCGDTRGLARNLEVLSVLFRVVQKKDDKEETSKQGLTT